jgi:deoxyadenosine/deoxycytidine kinase
MIEKQTVRLERREKEPNSVFHVTIVGAACSGKSTILNALQDRGFSVHVEPDNPVFPLFLENPKKYAFQNQLHKTTQLMQLEILDTKAEGLSDPHFRESGVLATDIYNRYLHDQGLIREDQFAYLLWLYNHHLTTFPTPDLVVYLHADDDTIRDRAIKRDGLVAHDPHELQPYWDRLLGELKERGVPVFRVNTGKHLVEATQQLILGEVERLKKEKRSLRPDVRTPVVRQFRFETTRPQ